MPEHTSAEVLSGLSGLTVVRARRKDTTPARLTAAPSRTRIIAATRRAEPLNPTSQLCSTNNHIATPISTPTSGGGILSSRNFTVIHPDNIFSVYGRYRRGMDRYGPGADCAVKPHHCDTATCPCPGQNATLLQGLPTDRPPTR